MGNSDALALNVIKEHFGHFVWLVADVLLTTGRQTLADLGENVKTRKTSNGGMPNPAFSAMNFGRGVQTQVQNALIVLLQHDLVSMEHKAKGARRVILYQLVVRNAIRRLRFGTFVSVAHEVFGEVGSSIMEELLSNGRMRMKAAVEAVAQSENIDFGLGEDGENPAGGENAENPDPKLQQKRDIVAQTFQSMIDRRYIAPQVPPLRAADADEPYNRPPPAKPVKRKAPTSSPTKGQSKEESKAEGEIVKKEKEGGEKKRQKLDGDQGAGGSGGKGGAAPPTLDTAMVDGWGGDGAEGGEDADGSDVDSDVIYVCGYEQVHRHLRNGYIVKFIGDKFHPNKHPRAIVEAMLALTEADEDCPVPEMSNPVTARNLGQQLGKFLEDAKIDHEMLIKYLQVLCVDQTRAVRKVNSSSLGNHRHDGGQFVVNISTMVECLKKTALDSVIKEKFGRECARICKVLLDKKQMEQKQLGEIAMIPAKETRQYLYKMMAAKIVTYQEIPKKADRSPLQTFYCWSVSLSNMCALVRDELYRAGLNLRLRRQYKLQLPASKELVSRMGELGRDDADGDVHGDLAAIRAQVQVQAGENSMGMHSEAALLVNAKDLKAGYEKMRSTLNRLDQAILRVDRTLMLFNDFT